MDITVEGLGERFEGDFADMLTGKFSLVSRGGRVEGLTCADPVARTPIDASGIILGNFGPIRVCALPLAAGINVATIFYILIFSLLVVLVLHATVFKLPEGVVVGIQIFAWAPKLYK